MDVLSDILSKVKLSSTVYFKSDFASPWGMEVSKGRFAQFHMVTRGQCVLRFKKKNIQLFAGDMVIFPLGNNHSIADKETSWLHDGQTVVQGIMNGKAFFSGNKVATTLVCGHFDYDKNMDHPFIKELPELIYISENEKKDLSWLESITNLVILEANNNLSGSDAIVNRLGEVLFIHALRAYLLKNESGSGFIAALKDERISKSLKAIHESPGKAWQLESLARISGMSRTSFSNRFKTLIGETPLNYITQWRILQAKELLTEGNKTVGEIAEYVGYQSEAAFNRVFKKRVKQTPLKYRQIKFVK